MTNDEKQARRVELHQQWTAEIRRRQGALEHESPLPAFLNLVTDRIIEIELRLEDLEGRGTLG